MPKKPDTDFVSLVQARPNFDAVPELLALAERHGNGLPLLQAVIAENIMVKDDACRLWAQSLGCAYVDPFASIITDHATDSIPIEIAKKTHALGLYIISGVLTTAMANPEDEALVKRLSQIAQMPISPVFALPEDIDDAILIQYSSEKNLEDSLNELEKSGLFNQPDLAADKIAANVDSTPVAGILDEIIYFAIRERATDIHIEAQEGISRIRFRIDGRLSEILTYSRKLHRAIISRLKIISNLNISESRFPQDGRFSIQIGSNSANFRLSTIPSQFGEKAVIRILAASGKKSMLTLDKMLISQPILQPLRSLIKNPSGIIFVTGPTGSGKTTTLYAALNEINTPDTNISTIEDPIEIQLPGVTQTQVNNHIDLKFSTVLRSLLRQDPDVILIGEIRDLETAKIATEAALTGHLVLATLHTNNAAQAIVRLVEIGVAPYMVAPSIIGVLAQRLAARICENCKEVYAPSPEVLQRYFHDAENADIHFYRGRGCSACRGTGYKGRVAFHELLLISEEIRSLISSGASGQAITAAAARIGTRSLRYDGLKKVLLGLTTIEEIEENTSQEWAN